MTSKRPFHCKQQQHSLSFRSTVLLIIFSSCWTQLASAKLACVSPASSGKSVILPGTPIPLGFSGTVLDTALSNITADLVCSSTGKTALSLGSGYDSTNFSPHSPQVMITDSQAAAATASCPTNVFHVQYSTSSLNQQVAPCRGNLSIGKENTVGSLSSPILPIPIISPPTSLLPSPSSQSSSSETATSQPSIQTTTTTTTTSSAIPITTSVTTPVTTPVTTTNTSTTPVHTSKPPNHTTQPVNPPTAPTTTASGNGGRGNGGGQATSSDSTIIPSPSTNSSSPSTASDFQSSSSPPTAVIASASVGVIAAIFVILAAMLIWRKRQQRKTSLDGLFMGDSSLAAASGFLAKPIYARSDPDEDQHRTRDGSVMVSIPTAEGMTRSQHGSPPPLMPSQPYPAAISMGQQDMGFYNGVDDVDHYQQQSPYRLPYSHPNYDYNSYGHHHG
ncbi:hypothetical protein BGX26_012605 [Mortierella sp. AD094]|nr:hypothetical protein BGX26_012605 [Mortierella sp. AD094]